MIVIDLTAEIEAAAATPRLAVVARERLQFAIVELVVLRRELFTLDARAACELDVALVRLLFGQSGGRA